MDVKNTRLRFAAATDPNKLSLYLMSLPFKVEIKGGPTQDALGKWFIWFVFPDHITEMQNLDMG